MFAWSTDLVHSHYMVKFTNARTLPTKVWLIRLFNQPAFCSFGPLDKAGVHLKTFVVSRKITQLTTKVRHQNLPNQRMTPLSTKGKNRPQNVMCPLHFENRGRQFCENSLEIGPLKVGGNMGENCGE